MTGRVDAAFAAICARAAAAADAARPDVPAPRTGPVGGRSGRDRMGLDVPTGVECEICPTGWAAVRLYDVDHPDGQVACARCAEKARMRAVTYGIYGPVVYRPLEANR